MTPGSPVRRLVSAVFLLAAVAVSLGGQRQSPHVLVFSRTTAFRHASIEPGIAAIRKLGKENGFSVDVHDVYFVFRNPQAKEGQNLFIVTTATFGTAPR